MLSSEHEITIVTINSYIQVVVYIRPGEDPAIQSFGIDWLGVVLLGTSIT